MGELGRIAMEEMEVLKIFELPQIQKINFQKMDVMEMSKVKRGKS